MKRPPRPIRTQQHHNDSPRPRGPNPKRLLSKQAVQEVKRGARLISDAVELDVQTRRAGGTVRARQTTITLVAKQGEDGHLIGLCLKDHAGLRFFTYPVQGPLDDALPHALEAAVLRCPALRDLVLVTPYKTLWDERNHTHATRDFVRTHGCRLVHAHPLPFDLGHTLARAASRGDLGPRVVDYHLYTASLTDGERTYSGAVLFGRGYAHQLTQTHRHTDLASAEGASATWAFKLMPAGSDVMIHNASPLLARVWTNPTAATPEVRDALRPAAHLLRVKGLHFKQGAEPFLSALARVAREMAAHAYAGADLTRSEKR